MYKLENTISDIGGQIDFIDNNLICVGFSKKSIKCINLNTFQIEWQAEYEGGLCLKHKNDIFAPEMTFYDGTGKIIYSNPLNIPLNYLGKNNEISVWVKMIPWKEVSKGIAPEYYIFDTDNKKILKQYTNNKSGAIVYIEGNLFVTRAEGGKVIIFDYNQEQVIWERDFSEECAYEDPISLNKKWRKAEIGNLYQYGSDKLIVKAGNGNSFCLDLKTGKQYWHKKYPGFYIIQGDTAFVYTNGGSIAKVDLKTGDILSNEGTFYRFPDLPPVQHKRLGEIHISPHGTEMVFHEDSLWFVVHSNGYSFVVKINPNTFEYEWIHQVDTPEEVRSIQFYKNKMYLHDLSHQLHVYVRK